MSLSESIIKVSISIVDSLTKTETTDSKLKEKQTKDNKFPLLQNIEWYNVLFLSLSACISPFNTDLSLIFKIYIVLYNLGCYCSLGFSIYLAYAVLNDMQAYTPTTTSDKLFYAIYYLFFSAFMGQTLAICIYMPEVYRNLNLLVSNSTILNLNGKSTAMKVGLFFLVVGLIISVFFPAKSIYEQDHTDVVYLYVEVAVVFMLSVHVTFSLVTILKYRDILQKILNNFKNNEYCFKDYIEITKQLTLLKNKNYFAIVFMFLVAVLNIVFIIINSYYVPVPNLYIFIADLAFCLKEPLYIFIILYHASTVNELYDEIVLHVVQDTGKGFTFDIEDQIEHSERFSVYAHLTSHPLEYTILSFAFRKNDFFVNLFGLFMCLACGYIRLKYFVGFE